MDIAYQLYSSRNAGPWEATLTMLAEAGFTAVEGFNGVYDAPAAFRTALDAAGLAMPTGHLMPLERFEEDPDGVAHLAKTLGIDTLYCAAPAPEIQTSQDPATWRALAARLERVAAALDTRGLAFGWHNHHWEFATLTDGTLPIDLILEGAPSLSWEIDVAWLIRGGADPLAWIARAGHRLSAAHVKDLAPAGTLAEDGWADLGAGTIDWPPILAALRAAGVGRFVLEHDNPSDATRFATRSIAAFRGM